ncbi:ArsR family transcriptional regulator [Aeromicrobium sp. Leaf289]|uniref:ArsR/SmtB family transcription factor n=1 Tax=Aeromicrobium sp. Leaf289 TaxID=1736324 RepID=UPI0006F3F4A1|nr:metalloregulator ArsR/SmtB family transcription factor [Aeromicrobium sp. Leaf289]KQP75847.1 ArsR family transcriptional regulator [Aeromicrobium sp. Leaf289]
MLTLESQVDVMARLGRALADPTRGRILLALAESPRYPAALAGDLGLTSSNVSNHLACLRGCGLVVATPQGRHMRYELADVRLRDVLALVFELELVVECADDCTPDAGPAA